MTLYRNFREAVKKTHIFKVFERFVVNSFFITNYRISLDDFYAHSEYHNAERNVVIDNIPFTFVDLISSVAPNIVADEFKHNIVYDFSQIDFKPGDIVIDIGANIGVVSIYLAKKYPYITIYAFEPCLENYCNLIRNIELNKIPKGTILPYYKAVLGTNRDARICLTKKDTVSCFVEDLFCSSDNYPAHICDTITLPEIFDNFHIGSARLLKMDCEGCEYEILRNTPVEYLHKIEIFRGEIHENINYNIKDNADTLQAYIEQNIPDVKIERNIMH